MINRTPNVGAQQDWKFVKAPKGIRPFLEANKTLSKKPLNLDPEVFKKGLKVIEKPTLMTRLKRIPYVLQNIAKNLFKLIR
ncbi:hypothetical protein IJ541_02945 [bacterium]|nr:hypothetical protein [bacterium]